MDYARGLSLVRQKNPLVLCLTNFVTVNDCANALLAIGASPVMSLSPSDAAELATISSALVLNIGTIDGAMLETMLLAAKAAREKGVPIVLDPVGAGASRMRLTSSMTLIAEAKPTIVRGNASEILALIKDRDSQQKGVDSSFAGDFERLKNDAAALARDINAVVAVTGPEDIATDGETTQSIPGGTPLLTRVTGTGCLLSAMVGAFVGADPESPLEAAASAMALLKKAGENALAALSWAGALGEFKTRLIDGLSLA
jgi:hydroxyethylthiazole kinase